MGCCKTKQVVQNQENNNPTNVIRFICLGLKAYIHGRKEGRFYYEKVNTTTEISHSQILDLSNPNPQELFVFSPQENQCSLT